MIRYILIAAAIVCWFLLFTIATRLFTDGNHVTAVILLTVLTFLVVSIIPEFEQKFDCTVFNDK